MQQFMELLDSLTLESEGNSHHSSQAADNKGNDLAGDIAGLGHIVQVSAVALYDFGNLITTGAELFLLVADTVTEDVVVVLLEEGSQSAALILTEHGMVLGFLVLGVTQLVSVLSTGRTTVFSAPQIQV